MVQETMLDAAQLLYCCYAKVVFRRRFGERISHYLGGRGVDLDGPLEARALTVPGDDDALVELRHEFERLDSLQHR